MKRKQKSRLEVTLMYLIIIIMSIIIFYPLIWTVGLSFNQGTSLYSSSIIPERFSLEHYNCLFSKGSDYLLWYKNSLIVSFSVAAGSVVITALVDYAFSRYQCIGNKTAV